MGPMVKTKIQQTMGLITGVPRAVGVVYKIRTAYVLCQQTLISDT